MRSSQAHVLTMALTLVGAQAFGATYYPVTQTSTNPPPAEANRTFVGWYDRAGYRIFDEFGRRVASQFCDFIVAEWVDASGQIVSPIPRPGAGDFGSYNKLPSAVVNRDGVNVWEMVSEDYAVSASCTFGTAKDAVLRPPHGRVVVDRGTVTIWFDASLSDINLNIYGCSAKESDGSLGQDACGGSAGIYLPEGKTLVLRRVDTTAHKVNIFAQGGNGLNADNGAAGASPSGNDCPGTPEYAGGLGGRGAGSGGAGIGAAGVAGGFGGSGGIGGYREGNSSYKAANSYKDAASGHSGMVGGNMGNLFVFDGITLAANAGVSGSCGTGGDPGHKGGPVTYWGGCGGGGGGGAAGPSARIGGAGSSGGGGGGGGGGHDGGGGGGGGGAGGPLNANETNGGKGAEGCYSNKYVGKDGGRGTFEVGGAGGARGEDTDDPDESGYPGAAGGERPDANGGGGYADLTLENTRRDFVSAVLSYPATGDEYKKSGQCPTRGRVIELDAGVGADSLRAEDKQMLAIGDTVAPTPVVVPRRYGQKFCGYFDKDRSEAAQRDVFVFNEFGRLVQGEKTSATKLVARWEGLPLVEPLVKLTLVTNNVGDVSAVVKLTVPYAQSVELVVSDKGPQSSGTRTVDKKTDLAAGPHEFTIDLGLNIWDATGSVEGGRHVISVVYATKRTGDSGFDTSYRQETSVYVAKREVPIFDEATKTLFANGSALDIRRDTRDASKVVVRFDRNRDGIYEGALPRAYSLSGTGCWVNGGFKSKEWAGGAKINFVSGDVWGISVGSNHVGGAAHGVTTGDDARIGGGGKEGW